MPLYKKIRPNKNTSLLVWKVDEDFDTLISKVQLKDESFNKVEKFKSQKRKIEFLIVRILLEKIGFTDEELKYRDSGAPYLDNAFISISHSSDYVAVTTSDNKIGVDIEKNREQIFRIAHKFINNKEKEIFDTSDLETLSIIWNAKEAMFKLCDKVGIDFRKNINVNEIDIDKGLIEAELIFDKETKKVSGSIDIFDNHTLVCVGFD